MSKKLTILFDLDGTLIDTAPDLMLAHNHVMKKFGYDSRQLLDIKKLAGKGSKAMLTTSIRDMNQIPGSIKENKKNIEKMSNEFINFYGKNIYKDSKLKNGVLDFLKWCKKNFISMAVCTNKQEHLSIDLLKKIKIYDFFDYVAGGNTFDYNKPDPRHLTSIVEIIGADLKNTLMIGDSETDANAAQAAKVPFILIEDGYTEKKTNEIHHNHLVKDFVGLENIIRNYFK